MPPLDWRGSVALWGGEAGPKMTGLVLGGVRTHRPGVPGRWGWIEVALRGAEGG